MNKTYKMRAAAFLEQNPIANKDVTIPKVMSYIGECADLLPIVGSERVLSAYFEQGEKEAFVPYLFDSVLEMTAQLIREDVDTGHLILEDPETGELTRDGESIADLTD